MPLLVNWRNEFHHKLTRLANYIVRPFPLVCTERSFENFACFVQRNKLDAEVEERWAIDYHIRDKKNEMSKQIDEISQAKRPQVFLAVREEHDELEGG